MESLGRYKDKLIECKEQQYMVVWGFLTQFILFLLLRFIEKIKSSRAEDKLAHFVFRSHVEISFHSFCCVVFVSVFCGFSVSTAEKYILLLLVFSICSVSH